MNNPIPDYCEAGCSKPHSVMLALAGDHPCAAMLCNDHFAEFGAKLLGRGNPVILPSGTPEAVKFWMECNTK